MKKIFNISITTVAILALAIACNKDVSSTPGSNPEETTAVAGETLTIKATLSDALTRVSFAPSYDNDGKTNALALTWAEGDKIRVYDHADRTHYEDFTLVASAVGQQVGEFSGTAFDAASYDVDVVVGNFDYADQTQPSDGEASDLKYLASVSDITDITDIVFTSFSSVLAITAKMPSTEAAAAIKSVDITASKAIFDGGNSLTITLDTPGSDDAILNLFATLPIGDQAVPAGTSLLVHFNAPNTNHTVYTRFIELGASVLTFAANTLNTININATKSDLHAGLTSCDGSNAEKAYLIGDKYQMDAMHELMERGEKKYFKLIDDVDMTGIIWFPLNNGYPESGGTKYTGNTYDKYLDFNGNNKIIKNLSTKSTSITSSDEYASIFGVLMGNVYDLTIDNAHIYPRGKSGILAGYVGTSNYGPSYCEVKNVTIENSIITDGGSYCGALAGQSAKPNNVFSNITISDCKVSTTGYAAGLVAYFSNTATVSDVTVQGTDITSTGNSNTATPVPDDGIAGGIAARVNAAVDFDRCYYKKNTTTNHSATLTGPKNIYDTNTPDQNTASNTNRYVGGLVGYVSNVAATFDACEVNTITINLDAAGKNNNSRYLGGAFGYIGASVKVGESTKCEVVDLSTGNYVRNYVGGFIGYCEGGSIKNSKASGTISGDKYGRGGFVAVCNGGTFMDNSSSVNVNGANQLGGFAGIPDGGAEFSRCVASGNINGTDNLGGFVGTDKGSNTYEGCSASGNIDGAGKYIGGFCGVVGDGGGTAFTGSFKNCFVNNGQNTISIKAGSNSVGGFVGWIGHNTLTNNTGTVEKCHVAGVSITAHDTDCGPYVGGFAGVAKTNISKSWAEDISITSNKNSDGGFVGYLTNATVSDCFAKGISLDVLNNKVGGFVGNMSNASATVERCYSEGQITCSYSAGGFVGARVGSVKYSISWISGWSFSDSGSGGDTGNYFISATETGTVSSHAQESPRSWSSTVWDFSNDYPTLK